MEENAGKISPEGEVPPEKEEIVSESPDEKADNSISGKQNTDKASFSAEELSQKLEEIKGTTVNLTSDPDFIPERERDFIPEPDPDFISARAPKKLRDFMTAALPLTLIAFRGGDAVSCLIRLLEKIQTGNGDFSHVGLLINSDICPFIPGLESNKIYVWESTMSARFFGLGGDGVADPTNKKTRFGVQIRDLEELLPKYLQVDDTAVAFCNLVNNPWRQAEYETIFETVQRRAKIVRDMKRLYKKYHRKTYEINCLQLCSAAVPGLRNVQKEFGEKVVGGVKQIFKMPELEGDDDDFVFCSEFVALIYQGLGIIDSKYKPHEAVPVDFFGSDRDGIPRVTEGPVYLES